MPNALDKWGFTEGVRACEELGLIPERLPLLDGASNAVVRVGGRELVNFAGIDLLGWQHDPGVLACFHQAVQRFGLVTGGSRVSQGVTRAHRDLEDMVRTNYEKESAISFASGLLANIGFVHAMSSKLTLSGSFEVDFSGTVFVFDSDCHWSLWKAAEKQAVKDRLLTFRHNDVEDLRAILENRPDDRVVVAFETVYSIDGSVAPIGEILDLCKEHGAVSYADDANGFMLYGPEHRPFAREFAELRRATFIMTSLSKAAGLEGGVIAGPADAIYAFEFISGTTMFTAAIQPPTAAAAAYALRTMRDEPDIVDRYLNAAARLRERLSEMGCCLNPTMSYIVSILIGADDVAEKVRRSFLDRGYLVPVFRYPAARRGEAVIRLIPNARLSEVQIDGFLGALGEIKKEYGF